MPTRSVCSGPGSAVVQRLYWGFPVLYGLLFLSSLAWAESWQEQSSQHFRVFYRTDAAFAKAVIEWAEHDYRQITSDLGLQHVVKRDRVPWLWDNRCRIYLYADRQAYLRATGAPAWSGGLVDYRQRVVYSFSGAVSFLESTLPHELAHILFREYVGFDNRHVPRWLDEGVAQYAEVGKRAKGLTVMRQWLQQGTYVSLDQLHQLPVNRASAGVARLFYTQAVTLVHFFLEVYGSRRFITLCSNLRDGQSIERAMSFATASQISSLRQLEDAWRHYLLRSP